MTQPAGIGREMRATYAFVGAVEQLERTAPLAAGEQVLLHGAMRLRGHGLLPRPVVLRLTAGRLTILAHYAFRPDHLWELPRAAVRGVHLASRAVRVEWARDEGAVAAALQTWLESPDGGNQL